MQIYLLSFIPLRDVRLEVLNRAGADNKKFSGHSTRSASVSAAKTWDISVKTILDAAGWSNAETFAKFCESPVLSDDCSDNYDYCLLKALDSGAEKSHGHPYTVLNYDLL